MSAPAVAWAPDPDALAAAPAIVHRDAEGIVWRGDCRAVLADLPAASIDAIVTDPPYDLTTGKRLGTGGFMGQTWDATGVAFDPATWAEALRVLKPGGHVVAFGGTRTYHRMACAIEDAGFEIRDSLHWVYGQGFPKSLDVGKAIDKAAGATREILATGTPGKRMIPGADQNRTGSWIKDNGREYVPTESAPATPAAATWQGWGTALRPAHEPIVLARKPIRLGVAANVLAHGTGAINVDGCRIAAPGGSPSVARRETAVRAGKAPNGGAIMDDRTTLERYTEARAGEALGRWPANVLLSHGPGCGPVECAPGCPVAELDDQSGVRTSGKMNPTHTAAGRSVFGANAAGGYVTMETYGDSGGASRFFPVFRYEAKARQDERPNADGVSHPTVKPLDLMRWLVRLVTPPGGTVLDMFAGSGTTGEAAVIEGFGYLLIERHAPYIPLIRARLSKPLALTMFGDDPIEAP